MVMGRSGEGRKGRHLLGRRSQSFRQTQSHGYEKGEQAFFYHSNEGKAVVGIVKVIKEYYPDHTDASGRFGMVDFQAVKSLKRPVTLDEIKAESKLSEMVLVNNSRLSVQPVRDDEWELICKMGGL